MTAKEKTYDNLYGDKRSPYETPHGLMAFLFTKLRRYEVNRYQSCLGMLPTGKGRLLDVGCGDGEFMFMAKHNFKECYGVDVSAARIWRTKAKAGKRRDENRFHFLQRDVEKGLPFEDAFFDSVTCISVLEHVFNPPNVIDEVHRVLKLGGIFIVSSEHCLDTMSISVAVLKTTHNWWYPLRGRLGASTQLHEIATLFATAKKWVRNRSCYLWGNIREAP